MRIDPSDPLVRAVVWCLIIVGLGYAGIFAIPFCLCMAPCFAVV